MTNIKKEAPIDMKSKVVQDLIKEANANVNTKSLTYEQALELVIENFDKVTSKNGMLKLLRAEGYSIAMNRLFKIYEDYKKVLVVNAKPVETK